MNVRREAAPTPAQGEVGLLHLIGMALARPGQWFRRRVLLAQLRSLRRLAAYFEWQEANGRMGLADTHRRIAITQSDLNALH